MDRAKETKKKIWKLRWVVQISTIYVLIIIVGRRKQPHLQ